MFVDRSRLIFHFRGVVKPNQLRRGRLKKYITLCLYRLFFGTSTYLYNEEEEHSFLSRFFPRGTLESTFNYVRRPRTNIDYGEKKNAVFLGRLSVEKNIEFLINSWVSKTLWLDIYGPWSNKEYEARCKGLVKDKLIRFHGSVESGEASKILSRYKLFVSPTLGENFGHSIFEAMAAGNAILLSNHTPWMPAKNGFGWNLELDLETWQQVVSDLENQDLCLMGGYAHQRAMEYYNNLKFQDIF